MPAPRVPSEDGSHRHRALSLAELINNATMIIQRDSLAPSGYLVVESRGTAKHQHSVWSFGPFVLLDDGWFGKVHGCERTGASPARWLAKHERRCHDQHWTQFEWIDPALLDAGCGAANIGLGLSPDGPTYCSGHEPGQPHPPHVPLAGIFRDALALLAAGPWS